MGIAPSAEREAPPAARSGASALGLDEASYHYLVQRIGDLHLKRRIGIEKDYEAHIFGHGRNWFHIENWYSIHSVIRNVLRCVGLHSRGRRNALDIRVRRNDVVLPALPEAFENYTILHLSDLHLDINGKTPQALIDAVCGLQYDVCVLTGDFRARTYGAFEPSLQAMQRLRAHLRQPVYAVLGNHDSIRMVPALEAMGIRMLLNESVALARGGAAVYLAGIDDPHYFRADNLEKAAADIPANGTSILLSHSPEVYQHAAHADFDVMFCGHTHGGQICLPGGFPILYNARCPRRLCAGRWRHHKLVGYTSVGAGSCIVDVRLNCPPEVTLHRLTRSAP